jgi:hypothetical protein
MFYKVKVNTFLSLEPHEMCVSSFTQRPLHPLVHIASGTDWIGDWLVPRVCVDKAEKGNICWVCWESNHDSLMAQQLNCECTACATTCSNGCCLSDLHRPVFSCCDVLSGNQPRKLTFAEEEG